MFRPTLISFLFAISLQAFAADKPEALILQAKKAADGHPIKVDAIVSGKKSLRIMGIVVGKDFDLTIETPSGAERQIGLGGTIWISADGGKTFKKGGNADPYGYSLVYAPIKYNAAEKIPPFEAVEDHDGEAGEKLTRFRFIAPNREDFEGDRPNYWVVFEGEKPTGIRRYHGSLGVNGDFVNVNIHYSALPPKTAVLAPPGNPLALPAADRPESILAAALAHMTTGHWDVRATVAALKTTAVHGLIIGNDFDLTMDPGGKTPPIHQIAVGDKSWVSFDADKTWKPADSKDRDAFEWLEAPIAADRVKPAYENLGAQPHGAESWLHLRQMLTDQASPGANVPEYWVLLDVAGKPLYVRQYSGALLSKGSMLNCEAEYAPAAADSVIKPPQGQ